MGTTFSPGQLVELLCHVNVATATALPQIAKLLGDPKHVLNALNGKTEMLANHLESAVADAIGRMLVLRHIGSVTLTLERDLDPVEYYRDRSGLWVYDDFQTSIAEARPIKAGITFTLNVHEIVAENGATDAEIEAALPKHHCFDETQVCGVLAALFERQWNGESAGLGLEHTGRVNLLYLGSCVASAYRRVADRKWNADTWVRGRYRWRVGRRVFSPAN